MFRVHHMAWAATGQNTQDGAGTPRSEETGRLEVAATGPWGVAPAAASKTLSQRHRCRTLKGLLYTTVPSVNNAVSSTQRCKSIDLALSVLITIIITKQLHLCFLYLRELAYSLLWTTKLWASL